MPDRLDPRTEDVTYGDRRISRPDASLPDWEMPDTAYRPIPIVWFTGALIAEFALVSVLLMLLWGRGGWLLVALATLGTAGIAFWTWERGMKHAGAAWQGATAIVLAALLGLACLAALGA
ncbi:MAG: hypothetical protein WA985_05340 [Erythrobacter sp.]|uniref:hypothetical protein n=1 Tax=Erythrobacter sp. TaxID=1042 RepID=UPI003C70F097